MDLAQYLRRTGSESHIDKIRLGDIFIATVNLETPDYSIPIVLNTDYIRVLPESWEAYSLPCDGYRSIQVQPTYDYYTSPQPTIYKFNLNSGLTDKTFTFSRAWTRPGDKPDYATPGPDPTPNFEFLFYRHDSTDKLHFLISEERGRHNLLLLPEQGVPYVQSRLQSQPIIARTNLYAAQCDNITITFFDYDPHIKAIERPIQNTGQLILRDIHQRGNSIRLILYYDYPKGPYVPQYGGGALPNSNGSIITGTNFQQDMGSLQITNSAIFSCPVQLLNSDQTPI